MRSTSLGKQRASRRSHRNGAVGRFLAALGASVVIGFGVGAPLAAARGPAPVPLHSEGGGRGDTGHSGGGSHADDEHLREQFERIVERLRAEIRDEQQRREAEQSTSQVQIPPTTVPPVHVPRVPVTVPTSTVALRPLPGANGVGASGSSAATRTGASGGLAGLSTANGGAVGATPPAAQQAPTPPAAAPATAPRSGTGVARALRTARSYGALLALAAVVVIFLLVQGRVDRRDPRILSAPVEDQLPFRDFE